MSKGTILYIGSFELPDKNAAAHRVLSNAKIFRELGYNVVFIDVDRNSKSSLEISSKKNIQGFDCWSRKFPDSPLQWIKYLLGIKAFKDIAAKYDNIKALICYNFQSGALLRLKNYCKKKNIKLIADCTEWYEDKRIIKKIDTVLRMEYIHKKIDGVICISSYLEEYYQTYVKTVIIPPLVDLEEEKWQFREFKSDTNKLHFVYSGRPGKHKDKLNYIIEALNTVNRKYSYIFTIIGITKQQYLEYYPEHRAIIDRLQHCIEFLGEISHDKSLKYVKSADFVIFIREDKRANNAGFPTKFVESMTCGIPVITTRTSDLINYLSDGKNGFFININNNITSTIEVVLQLEREKINDMKSQCKAENPFSYQNYINSLEKFMKRVEEK